MRTKKPRPIRYETEFFAKTIHAERCLLALGWLQPIKLNDAGADIQLSTSHFMNEPHGFLYWYLCLVAESQGQGKRYPDIEEYAKIAQTLRGDRVIDTIYWLDELLIQTDVIDGMIETYAETVLDGYTRRQEAIEAFKIYRHVIKDYQGV